jgi:hypothetical protein
MRRRNSNSNDQKKDLKRKSEKISSSISMPLARTHIVNQVASLLYAWKVLKNNEEVVDIQFGDLDKEVSRIIVSVKEVKRSQRKVD